MRVACCPPIIRVSRQFRYPILCGGHRHRISSFRQLSWGCTKLFNRSIHSYVVSTVTNLTNRYSFLDPLTLNMLRPQSTDVIYSNIWARAAAAGPADHLCLRTNSRIARIGSCSIRSKVDIDYVVLSYLPKQVMSHQYQMFGRKPNIHSCRYTGSRSLAPHVYFLPRKLGLFTEIKLQFDKLVRLSPDWM